MPNYFVVVSRLKDKAAIDPKRSGRLWAENSSVAEIEAGRYREKLNPGGLEWCGENFYVVTVITEAGTRKFRGYTKWWKNRVTKPIKSSTLRKTPTQRQRK